MSKQCKDIKIADGIGWMIYKGGKRYFLDLGKPITYSYDTIAAAYEALDRYLH